ncbi:dienelactone hydrolase [Leptospira hartskeerlii]|uniref:Dienelactone hydrolase n=1 Tax=Leptospira hartskeerlii TaxID=2023177 RepID=A0A2M9XFC8_9LEPT|nr:dienelactone hydrolase [Leptospira hartskeerlii]PJZ26378.1 dienelactone hydrolase [Leptospira hartskeerlii]PJZ34463.1 dienelactone hydrolase [Leptospira hartskeerlii]
MVRYDIQTTLDFQVNRVQLKGELFIPSQAVFLAVLVLDEKDDKFTDRFSKMRNFLNERGVATLFLKGLLTQEEREIHANRSDVNLLSDRLSEITKQIRNIEGASSLKISYIGSSSIASRMFRAAGNADTQVESLILIGNGLQEYSGKFLNTSVLNILGELDFTGRIVNRSVLSKIETSIKKVYFVPGSPSHFEDSSKWFLVSEAIQKWYLFPEKRSREFSEF